MGDVVQLSDARRSRPRIRPATDASVRGAVALFTGVRIERWGDRQPDAGDAPKTRPTAPRGPRRRR